MKILFVVNNFYFRGNGLSASARRTVQMLKEKGEEVRVLSGKNPDKGGEQPEYCLEHKKIPFFNSMIGSQGYIFAKLDRRTVREAVMWADIIHLEEPFFLQIYVTRVAKRLGVPCTGTYHLHPENMLATLHLHKFRFLSESILRLWRDLVFNKCSDIQCPTQNVLNRLQKSGFRSRLHLISNGVAIDRSPHIYEEDSDIIRIICIGRYSVEKDQETLLNALRLCRNAGRIRLYLEGRGPLAERYSAMAQSLMDDGILKYPPVLEFNTAEGLRELSRRADLYIHCASIEVEGLSCMEAIQQEVVPVIADSDLSATSQFALDRRSLFPAGNAAELARAIDYWIDHPEERRRMAALYSASMDKYEIGKSVDELIGMFRKALLESR